MTDINQTDKSNLPQSPPAPLADTGDTANISSKNPSGRVESPTNSNAPSSPAPPSPGSVPASGTVPVHSGHSQAETSPLPADSSVSSSATTSPLPDFQPKSPLPSLSSPYSSNQKNDTRPLVSGNIGQLPQNKPASISYASPAKSKKGLFIFIISMFLGLAIVAGTGFFAYQQGYLDNIKNKLSLNFPVASRPTPNPTPLPEPTSIPTPEPEVFIPANFATYNHSICPRSISHPPEWSTEPDCIISAETPRDCLLSQDYEGQMLSTGIEVFSGLALTISCVNTEMTSIDQLLADCQNRIALTPGELNTCQQFDAQNKTYVQFQSGNYQTLIDQQLITVQVYPPPPTAFQLINQILGTIR